MEHIFQAENIFKQYAQHQALTDVSIAVPRQGIFGLLGPNGAGKTTLIRIINQIIAPDKGTLLFEGDKLRPEHVKRIGYLPEERGLYKKMEIGEQAIYLARLKGVAPREAKRQLRDWFEKFDLMPWWNKKVEELSKGMQQKVQFIITILHQPDLLIFDEPFSGFDPINVNLLKEEILKLKDNGATIIFSTHNMSSVEELCDHIALIHQSRKILDGRVQEIRKSHSTNLFKLEISHLQKDLQQLLPRGSRLLSSSGDQEGLVKAMVQISADSSANELIRDILPYAQIHGFHEQLPTMNDIFIKNVTGKYPMENGNPDTVMLTGNS